MWDNGSTLSFVIFKKDETMKLNGRPVDLKITVVGGESKSMKSYVYKLVLHSTQGQRIEKEAYGIQTISPKIEAVALDKLAD